jgi:hypothetical protein
MEQAEFNKISKVAVDLGTPLYDEMRAAALNSVWFEAPELKDKLPKDWCRMESDMSVTFRGEGESRVVSYTLESETGNLFKLPPNYSRWGATEVTSSEMTPLIKEWVTNEYARERSIQATVDLFGNIKKQLTDFLESHASLNTALKEMPELEMYVPDDYLGKVKEKTVRVKKEKEDVVDKLNIDVDALTRAAVAHRITSAGN